MFVGHYAAALAIKAAEPRAPLWTLAAGCQLVDIGWSALVMADIERVRIDESLPGSPLDLYHMPYTHSLPAALAWSAGAAVLARLALRPNWRVAGWIAVAVFSHWVLDFLVHRPDLALWPGGPKVGLALWNYPVPEQAIEIGVLGLACAALTAKLKSLKRAAWPAIAFMGFLVALQIAALVLPRAPSPAAFAMNALIVYLVVTGVAWLADRGKTRAA
ncbi:MAG: hypothetical protein GC189_05170 [Alphaproteobacteria bacterium]|nr:hypothetical protein [Alphaproteobacteria bacterium]